MCRFLSTLLLRDGRIVFTESNHHSLAIERAGVRDGNLFTRHFVRLECPVPHQFVKVDEQGTLPSWFMEQVAIPADCVEAFALSPRLVDDAILPRVHAIADAVTKLKLERSNAYERAKDWEREEKEKLAHYQEHPWLYPGNYEAGIINLHRDMEKRQAVIEDRYRVGYLGIDGYLPPREGAFFVDDEKEFVTGYVAQWTTLPRVSTVSYWNLATNSPMPSSPAPSFPATVSVGFKKRTP